MKIGNFLITFLFVWYDCKVGSGGSVSLYDNELFWR